MAGVVMNRILDFLGVEGEPEEQEDVAYEPEDINEGNEYIEPEDKGILKGFRKNKVVSMPQTQQIKMKISKPTTFEQAEDICILLKEKNAVVVNLEYVNKDVARRIVDFVSGSVTALDAHIEKVSNSIFVVAPCNYDIVNDMAREEIKGSKLSVSWLK